MGKARYIGASSMMAWQFCEALHRADRYGWTRFVSMQPHYNLLNREEEREMLPLCRAEGIGVLPWSPLARGRLARAWDAPPSSSRVANDKTAERLYSNTVDVDKNVIYAVSEIAQARGISQVQVALAWLLQQPAVSAPIVGVTKPFHLEDAVGALAIRLEPVECANLERYYVPHAVSFIRSGAHDLSLASHAAPIAPAQHRPFV